MKHLFFAIVITTAVCFVGCGKGISVNGKVTFPDGSPLTVGEVVFQTETVMASGRIQPDGTYRLVGAKEGDGIPPNHYGVRITGACKSSIAPPGTLPEDVPPPIPLIDEKFEKTETSELTCDVKGAQTFNITVTAPNGKTQ